MTDEQIASLITAAEDRASILYLSVTRDAYEDGNLMDKLVECIDAQAAEITRLREAQWAVRHADTANDMVLMGMARDSAIAERDAARAENARLRDALFPFAEQAYRYEPEEDDGGEEAFLSRFLIRHLRAARAALAQETQP